MGSLAPFFYSLWVGMGAELIAASATSDWRANAGALLVGTAAGRVVGIAEERRG